MLPAPVVIRSATEWLSARARWQPLEIAFWLAAFAAIYLFPDQHLILTEIAWLGLFALSLDLILGYAGIISLGNTVPSVSPGIARTETECGGRGNGTRAIAANSL